MKKILNKFIGFIFAFVLIFVTVCFVACGNGSSDAGDEKDISVTAKQTTLTLDVGQVADYDYTSLFTITSDGASVEVTEDMIEHNVKAEAGEYSVTCEYQNKSASVEVTVTAASGGTDWGDWADVHNAKSTIKTHPEGQATYRFQAECTDLRGKGYAPGFSGGASTYADMVVATADGVCVSYLYAEGLTINFLVVSDRDVDDATLSFRLGAEYMNVPVTPDVFSIRVDRKISDEDLYSYDDPAHMGALGMWDEFFLNTYTTPEDTDFYTIDKYECPEGTEIKGANNTKPGSFETVLLTTKLSLKQGVNCISFIIEGADLPKPLGTMECMAPCVDYMEITTDAQLGFFGQYDNGGYGDGLSIV